MDLSSARFEATRRRLQASGASIDPWWDGLPKVLDELTARWKLDPGEPLGRGNTSLVVGCRRADGRAAVLKLSPDPPLVRAEAQALGVWQSSRRVPLLWECDAELGALLLERIPVKESVEMVDLDGIAALIEALHRGHLARLGGDVRSLSERVEWIFDLWIERSGRDGSVRDAVSVARLERGRNRARALAATGGTPVLLHGDLHPGNVLAGANDRGLVAIDPRPCVGEGTFDAVDWVFEGVDDRAGWERRSRDLASMLGYDCERLWSWCVALAAVLAASEVRRHGRTGRVTELLTVAP